METLFLTNCRIYTMDPGQPNASALLIQGGKITAVIDDPEAEDHPAGTKVQDLDGRTILPGLIDAHLHLRQYAESLQKIDCETETRSECLERVAERVKRTEPGKWILGHGWNHNHWDDGYGTAEELDRITTNHPIYLTGKSLHVSWANTAALEKAGIVKDAPDPPGGSIQRDERGCPTGIIFEKAVKLIEDVIPKPTIEETAKNILKAQESLRKYGITGVHDFDRELCIQALQLLDNRDHLRLRVWKSIPIEFLDEAIELGYRTGKGSDWFWFGGVKLFSDGALGPKTAALLEPYEESDELGMLLLTEEELFEIGTKATQAGLSLSVHAIGDLANRTVLDAIERLRGYEKKEKIQPLPHRIEHVQLIHPDDVNRLAELKVTASMQPIHATSDMVMAEKYWGNRTAYAYAPKYQINAGALLAFGSDAPVESPNPWWGIHAAVTRRRADGAPGPEGWHPEGKLNLLQALKAFTIHPAQAAGRGETQGRIAPRFWADLILLDADPFTISPDELMDLKPAGTMLNGEWVWRDM